METENVENGMNGGRVQAPTEQEVGGGEACAAVPEREMTSAEEAILEIYDNGLIYQVDESCWSGGVEGLPLEECVVFGRRGDAFSVHMPWLAAFLKQHRPVKPYEPEPEYSVCPLCRGSKEWAGKPCSYCSKNAEPTASQSAPQSAEGDRLPAPKSEAG